MWPTRLQATWASWTTQSPGGSRRSESNSTRWHNESWKRFWFVCKPFSGSLSAPPCLFAGQLCVLYMYLCCGTHNQNLQNWGIHCMCTRIFIVLTYTAVYFKISLFLEVFGYNSLGRTRIYAFVILIILTFLTAAKKALSHITWLLIWQIPDLYIWILELNIILQGFDTYHVPFDLTGPGSTYTVVLDLNFSRT